MSLSEPIETSFQGFLERYYDRGLRIPETSREILTQREIGRLGGAIGIVFSAGSLARRLGIEATDEELRLDKRRSRRVTFALRQSLRGWADPSPRINVTDEIKQAGAQLDWALFRAAHVTQLNSELRLVATWAVRNDEHRWGRSALVRLENEMRWFVYAMRE